MLAPCHTPTSRNTRMLPSAAGSARATSAPSTPLAALDRRVMGFVSAKG